jgi:malic enzyme
VHTTLNAAADNAFAFPCIGHTAIIVDVEVVDKGMMGKVAVMVKVLFTNRLNI